LAAEKAGVTVTDRGFIPTDKQLRTNIPHIFAIGDVKVLDPKFGGDRGTDPMLAHKAVPEGRTAAEVIAGKKHFFDPRCIPSVAYTDPEIAWTGLTEKEAKEKNITVSVGKFPWAASGRAISTNRTEGFTKVLFNEDNCVVGGGIVGPNAGELISEVTLAIEMGCDAEDISLTIHPHPTLSESVMMATEDFEGTATDLPPSKKGKK
jgi:dihydrolipoamide dehydrogenase